MRDFGRNILESIALIDNKHKSISYEGLALRCAGIGDSWLALHAQILSDASKYKVIMVHEGQSISDSILKLEEVLNSTFRLESSQKSYKVNTIINKFRKVLAQTIPTEIKADFLKGLNDLSELNNLKLTDASINKSLGNNRFASIEGYEFIRRKQDEATKLYIKAMNSQNQPAQAVVFLYQGDLAVFESWLVSQSIVLNDDSFVLAGIRWALASAALNNLEGLPNNTKKAAKEVRKALLWAVGPENSKSLTKYLLKF